MLPYTAEVLFAQIAAYNQAIWPAPPIAGALAFAILVMAVRPTAWSGRFIAAILAAGWIWTGIAYHFVTFATLNFAAPAYGTFFVLQGLLIGWTGAIRGGLVFRFSRDATGWTGLGLAIAAVFLFPLADLLSGHGWDSVRLAGIAPAPTACLTLGFLLLARGRVRWHLAILPLLWTVVAAATGWVLAVPQDMVLAAAGIAALALMMRKNARITPTIQDQ